MDWMAVVAGFRRRRHRRHDRRRRRLADDAAAAVRVQAAPGRGDRHRPVVCRASPRCPVRSHITGTATSTAASPRCCLPAASPLRSQPSPLMHFTGVTKGWASALTLSLGIALLLTAVTVAYRQAWSGRRRFDSSASWLPSAASRRCTVICRRRARRAGVAQFDRRRRDRRHADPAAVPAPRSAAHRRHRHRARGAADAGRRHRPRDARARRMGACSARC